MRTRLKLKQLELGLKKNQVVVSNGIDFSLVAQDKNLSNNFPNYTVNGTINTSDETNSVTLNQTTINRTANLRNPDDITAGLNKTVANKGSVDITVNGSAVNAGSVGLFSWDGGAWRRVGSNSINGIIITQEYTATTAQTVFIISGTVLSGSQTMFYINGARISPLAVTVAGNNVTYNPAFNNNLPLIAGDRINVDVYVNYVSGVNEYTPTLNQTVFTLSQALSSGTLPIAFINGNRIPVASYSVVATTLTYVPANNSNYQLQITDRFLTNY